MILKEMKEQFGQMMTQAETIRQKYQGTAEGMTGQEETEYMRIVDEAFALQGKIETEEKRVKVEAFSKTVLNPLPGMGTPGAGSDNTAHDAALAGQKSFRKFLLGGLTRLTPEDYGLIGKATSTKAYQADEGSAGGFLVSPQTFVEALITLVKDLVYIRQMATTYTLTRADSLGLPALDVDPSDADWTTELGTGNEENTLSFGKRELRPHPVAKRVKISNKLIRNAAINAEGVVLDRLAYKFGVTEEKAFLVGDGQDKPLGVFTASAAGIPTNRDMVCAGANAITGDDVMNLLYSLKAPYQADATFMLHRLILLAIRKLKDNNNNYIWATGFGPGQGYQGAPSTILGRPYVQSEYCPSAISTGLYTMIVGSFKNYVIATALDMQLQVLDQLYAENNQTGYIARLEVDGMPVLSEAFARLKQA